ncbi:bifunctional UDP-N-acetylglucosamine pyrophosphorylase / Glucosamine-1-phosphate N-acetyltransferase [Parelusimicrobium proximum]|uniref:bifunctional UDP-N-acetylglucosamine diphosphorylase/glucosamine-1-phosphate N-acetyltransferase GlmU n=1 Tax=Parelusimicrobium proximum TaxID=3228953 RepID=UPI003D186937
MKNNNLCVLILAGGKGTRMKSPLPKPLHKICGKEIIAHILKTAQELAPAAICVLLGHDSDNFKAYVKEKLADWGVTTPVLFALQRELTGSGTAVKSSLPIISKYKDVLILSGDAPLIKKSTLLAMYKDYKKKKSSMTILSVRVENPFGYGRVVRDGRGNFAAITEESVATAEEKLIKEINAGMYIADTKELKKALSKLTPKGPKKEYYLTDTIALIKEAGHKVFAFTAADYTEALGINSKIQLSEAAGIMFMRKAIELMEEGVSILNPALTYIEADVKVGADTVIYPNVYIEGDTVIGRNNLIETGCVIKNAVIADNVEILANTYINKADVSSGAHLGPMAHLRPGAILKEGAKVGNFSEVKKSVIGKGSKVNHLSYIGDTEMGEKVNIGAGTITCNYDGVNKYKTTIGDGAFIGSNTNLVAPVEVGSKALIGAGSTITKNVSADHLAIARARQVELEKKIKKGNCK